MPQLDHRQNSIRATAALLTGLVVAALALSAGSSAAEDPGTRSTLESTRENLAEAEEREGVLTTTLERFTRRISGLEERTVALREREAMLSGELLEKQAALRDAEAALAGATRELEAVRGRLRRALVILRRRVVAIYESGSPDITSLILTSGSYSEIATRGEYLARIEAADEAVVERVESLRDDAEETTLRLRREADQVEAARDEIAARATALGEARTANEARTNELVTARSGRRRALGRVQIEADRFGADIEALQEKIAAELNAASVSTIPPAAIEGSSSAGLVWPVDGVITSGFGPRWGSFHPGLDIGAAEGTPIRAAAAGTVVLMQSEAESGGYGNYACLEHSAEMSTCYAHQSEFATTVGASVAQGEVIGYVGNTGFSTGPHLHFEVRIAGEPQDPLGYL